MKKVIIIQRAIPNYRLPLFRALCADNEFEITIGCADYDEGTSTGIPAENYSGVRQQPLKMYRIGRKLLFQSIVSLKSYDLVILDTSTNLLSVPVYLFLCRIKGIPVIGWGKGVPQLLNVRESWLKRTYKKLIISCCRCLIVYGRISKNYYNELGFSHKPMFIAQNSIDTNIFFENFESHKSASQSLREELNLQDRFIFGYFGKLIARKKVDQIIIAFRKVLEKHSSAVLILAGEGPARPQLQKEATDLILAGSLIFLGRVPNGEEGKILHLMDAYLNFSQGGLGILEAMATGRTIISTPEVFPETELLVDDFNCFLSSDFSTGSFSAAMEAAINQRDKAVALGKQACLTVKEKAGIPVMENAFISAIRYSINQ